MAKRERLLTVSFISDDETGMYSYGEIDFGVSAALDEYIKNHGAKGKDDILSALGHLAYEVTKCFYGETRNGAKKEGGKDEVRFKKEIEFDVVVDVKNYKPERPAPPCSNPDSPQYSDDGDPMELEYDLYLERDDGKLIDMPLEMYYDKEVAEVIESEAVVKANSLIEDMELEKAIAERGGDEL